MQVVVNLVDAIPRTWSRLAHGCGPENQPQAMRALLIGIGGIARRAELTRRDGLGPVERAAARLQARIGPRAHVGHDRRRAALAPAPRLLNERHVGWSSGFRNESAGRTQSS
jgi:hypothetical protein